MSVRQPAGLPDQVAPTRDDSVVRALSEVVGGPAGHHAAGHTWWTPLRVILALTSLCFALGMLHNKPCWDDDWQSNETRYSMMCYSDLPYLYGGRGFDRQLWPYQKPEDLAAQGVEQMEYPVGISYWAWATSKVTAAVAENDLEPIKEMKAFVLVNTIGFAILALLSSWLLTRVNPRRPWDAAGFALAPTLALGALINWDFLAVFFVAATLYGVARWLALTPPTWTSGAKPSQSQLGWMAFTGAMVGLGTAAKLYPLFLLGGLLIICLRRRDWWSFIVATVTAVMSWLLANAPGYLTGPEVWKHFWDFNEKRPADLGSIWLLISQWKDIPFTPETINRWSWAFFIVWCFAVLVIGLTAKVTPRMAQLGFLIVCGFLLINKVYSPQYMLWLLPLAVMARPRWRDLLIWQLGEAVYFAAVWLYLAQWLNPGTGDNPMTYWWAILARLAAELYLCAVVVRDIYWPQHDPVERGEFVETCENPPAERAEGALSQV